MHIRVMAWLAAALAAVLLAGCSSSSPSQQPGTGPGTGTADRRTPGTPGNTAPGLGRFYAQRLTWHGCPSKPNFQCSQVEVPLNYADPTGTTIKLAINRLPATGARIGSLLTNPGGPGGSGLDYLYSVGSSAKGITPAVRARYDLIGVDPRGVGQSAPVNCLDDAGLDAYYGNELSPQNSAQEATLRTVSQRFAAACQDTSGTVLPYVGTVNAVKDMDIIRAVLGDNALNYLGISYGTELGQVYAQLFPHSVGRMVLDSVVDTQQSTKQSGVTQMAGVERAFEAFVDDCLKQAACPLGGPGTTRAAAMQKISDLLTRLKTTPLPGRNGRTVNDSDARTALVQATYGPELWLYGRQALTLAFNGSGAGLQLLADAYRERDQNGHYSNMQSANLVIGCLETPAQDRTEPATLDAIAAMTKVSPFFGPVDTSLPCAYLKIPVDALPASITAPGAPPILLLNNLGDNATPIEWARAVAKRLTSSVLVTNDQSGHGVYGRGPCVNAAVDDYLVNAKMPSTTHCQDHGTLF